MYTRFQCATVSKLAVPQEDGRFKKLLPRSTFSPMLMMHEEETTIDLSAATTAALSVDEGHHKLKDDDTPPRSPLAKGEFISPTGKKLEPGNYFITLEDTIQSSSTTTTPPSYLSDTENNTYRANRASSSRGSSRSSSFDDTLDSSSKTKKKIKLCLSQPCNKRRQIRGFCRNHSKLICTDTTCNRKAVSSSGLCQVHLSGTSKLCETDGCQNLRVVKSKCLKHSDVLCRESTGNTKCELKAISNKGYCRVHIPGKVGCKVPNCPRLRQVRGYCCVHSSLKCEEPGCNRKAISSKGLCQAHLTPKRKCQFTEDGVGCKNLAAVHSMCLKHSKLKCAYDGCDRKANTSRGMCPKHAVMISDSESARKSLKVLVSASMCICKEPGCYNPTDGESSLYCNLHELTHLLPKTA